MSALWNEGWIRQVRQEMYAGSGYVVLRAFASAQEALRIRRFWLERENRKIDRVNKKLQFYRGCPNTTLSLPGQLRIHFNFFWNPSLDQATYDLCWEINALRNLVEGRSLSTDFFPTPDPVDRRLRACCFRIVTQQSGHGVAPHTDWDEAPYRLQTSLQLSEWGADYQAGGLQVTTNFGERVNVCQKERLKPGDLLIFRYANPHAVEAARTGPGQSGYSRIIFTQPPFEAAPPPVLDRAKEEIRIWLKRPALTTGEEEYPALIRPVEKPLRALDALAAADLERRRADLAAGRLPSELYAGGHPAS